MKENLQKTKTEYVLISTSISQSQSSLLRVNMKCFLNTGVAPQDVQIMLMKNISL